MNNDINSIEITKEDLKELTPEELVELKIELDEMSLRLESILQDEV